MWLLYTKLESNVPMPTPTQHASRDTSLPPSVSTGREPKRANAESRNACSRAFQSRSPFLYLRSAYMCACALRACLWGLGEGAVPKLSHQSLDSCCLSYPISPKS